MRRTAGPSSSPKSLRGSPSWTTRARSTSRGPYRRLSRTKLRSLDKRMVRPGPPSPRRPTHTFTRLALGASHIHDTCPFCDYGSRFRAVPSTLQRYFQHIRPLAQCDAEDGRVVGQMLHDLVSCEPKDPAGAVREFAHRTAMLRECGLAHIGDMLARLLSADVRGKPDRTSVIPSAPVPTTAVELDPSSLTEEQAIAIGAAIALSVREADMPATGLKRLVKSHAVLRAMNSKYAWFAPMLETIMAH